MGFYGPAGPGGFRRRGRRRGLIVGAAAGAAVGHHLGKKNGQDEQSPSEENYDYTDELKKLQELKTQGLITGSEFEAKKKQILGI